MGLLSKIAAQFRAAPSFGGDLTYHYGPYGGLWGGIYYPTPSSKIDYAHEAGDLVQNSVIQSGLSWIMRNFPEAPPRVLRLNNNRYSAVMKHPLTDLLRKPNAFYNGILLEQATMLSMCLAGNAYWLIARDQFGTGQPTELWWEPHTTITPIGDSNTFVTGYKLMRGGRWLENTLRTEDVVHFRFGLDPRNPRLGLSPLASALREVFADNEASAFGNALLRNMAVPGVVMSPKDGFTIDDPEELKNKLISKLGGDRRGEPLVMTGPTEIERLSFSPAEMDLTKLRRLPEERIPALLGLSAVVLGLGAGLEASTYTNYPEAREAAYENCILPLQRLFAAHLDDTLLVELGNPEKEMMSFDTSNVRALAGDQTDLMKRAVIGYRGGLLKRWEARLMANPDYSYDDTDQVYITDIMPLSRNAVSGTTNPGVDDSATRSNGHELHDPELLLASQEISDG